MSRSLSYFKSSSECAFKTRRRCLHSFESRKITGESSVNGAIASRRYAASAAARRPASPQPQSEYLDDEEFSGGGSRSGYGRSRSDEGRPSSVLYPKARPKANPEPLIEHLHRLFPPLEFPTTVASQMLTHISAQEAWAGHNGRLSFVGRRVLHSYLLLFLHSASLQLSKASPSSFNPNTVFDFDLIAYRALHTALLGEHVGAQWDLARVMLWTPPVRSSAKAASSTPLSKLYEEEGRNVQEAQGSSKSPGLYKVQGTTVEGIMGGVFHQFGGTVAQRVFHTRFLPHILCPGLPFGLHDAFHDAALEAQARMGGPDGLLMTKAEDAQERSQAAFPHSFTSGRGAPRGMSRLSVEPEQSSRRRILS